MSNNFPVRSHTPTEILDSMLAHILCGESPMDARCTSHEAPMFTLSAAEKNFSLNEIADALFLVLIERGDDIFKLAELCGINFDKSKKYFLNYTEFYYKLDNNPEIEFIASASSEEHMILRFKLLSVIDSLFSIAKIMLIKSSCTDLKIDCNGYTFRETSLLLRNLSMVYYIDKLKEKPRFERKDGIIDDRFSRFSAKDGRILRRAIAKVSGNEQEKFAERMRHALTLQEKELNERFYKIIRSLFDRIKAAKSEKAKIGPLEKEYIPNMTDTIYSFMLATPCDNQDQFKRLFGERYNEDNPYINGKNQYYVHSISCKFCRHYTDFTKHDRDVEVPDSSFNTAFKNALKHFGISGKNK